MSKGEGQAKIIQKDMDQEIWTKGGLDHFKKGILIESIS